ncbi:hypothetical protein GCM10027398_20700 [Azotobacter salinestris]
MEVWWRVVVRVDLDFPVAVATYGGHGVDARENFSLGQVCPGRLITQRPELAATLVGELRCLRTILHVAIAGQVVRLG